MNNIKALFFDIDGTLVPFGDHQPPTDVINALKIIRSNGIKIFISTGRHINWVDNLGKLEVDGYVTANGNLCVEDDRKTVIYKHCIPHDDIDRIIDFSHNSDIPIVAVPVHGRIIINREDESIAKVRSLLELPKMPITDLEEIRNKEIVQMMAFGSEEKRRKSGLFTDILHECQPTSWHPWFCDIIPIGSDKSVGIDNMILHHCIDISETVAFGDGGNDKGMLQHAGIGVAMGNAAPDVKAAADYVTTDVDNFGVINALRHLGLII